MPAFPKQPSRKTIIVPKTGYKKNQAIPVAPKPPANPKPQPPKKK